MTVRLGLAPLAVGAAIVLGGALLLDVSLVVAQEHEVGGLRISDETGAPIGALAAPPGEKYFHLDSGVQRFHIAFDFGGTQPTDVELRVLGPMGTVLFQNTKTYSEPGVQVVTVDSGVPLEDNEYVVNAYIGTDGYLADSLQLAVGSAQIPGSIVDEPGGTALPAQATMVPLTPRPTSAQTGVPGGPPLGILVVAGILLVVLAAVVIWATMSALRTG